MPKLSNLATLRAACRNADWVQVVLNGGPPCFHLEGNIFCLRAQSWHDSRGTHRFVPLRAMVDRAIELAAQPLKKAK